MLQEFSMRLGQTYLSALFSDTTHLETWLIIPVSQTLHILGVAIVMISVGMLNLKLWGVDVTRQTFSQLAAQLTPWLWGGLVLLFLTGAVQTIAEPTRELMNFTFRVKMLLLAIVVLVTAVSVTLARKNPAFWNLSPQHRRIARLIAGTSLVLWIGILAAGRLIAYMGAMQEF